MKKIVGILTFVLLLSVTAQAKNEILFRVQVGAYKKEEAPKDIRKIPKLKKYVLPEGYYCFFAGGYYSFFEGANRALKAVKELGYAEARIRVIRDDRLLSDDAAEKYVLKELVNPTPIPSNRKIDEQKYSIEQKKTLENRMILFKEITQPKTENNDSLDIAINKPKLDLKMKLKKFGWGKRKKDPKNVKPGSDSDDEKVADAEEVDENQIEEDTMVIDPELLEAVKEAVVEEKAEEIIDENDDNLMLPENFKVDDIPFFKIYLASAEKGHPAPRAVEYVPDIVYTYEKKDMTLYAVGYFKTSAEAQEDLRRYKDKGFYNARIIAIYKTIVVSQRMGDQILEKANK